MALALRRLLAVLSTIGLAASACAYIGSFFGLTAGPVSNAQPWLFYFFAGVFVTVVPISFVEYDGPLPNYNVTLKRYDETRPRWAAPAIKTAGLFFAFHFILFLVITRAGKFDIADGQYVLDHRVISEARYLILAGWETRFFASGMICAYLYATLYWWYPRLRTKPGPYEE